jgi:hypothetical protein
VHARAHRSISSNPACGGDQKGTAGLSCHPAATAAATASFAECGTCAISTGDSHCSARKRSTLRLSSNRCSCANATAGGGADGGAGGRVQHGYARRAAPQSRRSTAAICNAPCRTHQRPLAQQHALRTACSGLSQPRFARPPGAETVVPSPSIQLGTQRRMVLCPCNSSTSPLTAAGGTASCRRSSKQHGSGSGSYGVTSSCGTGRTACRPAACCVGA